MQDTQTELRARYLAAAESFVDKVKDDPYIIAVIVSGSLAYDVVWEKSDIDMTVVVRDQTLSNTAYCVMEDGITVNVALKTRSAFVRDLGRNIGGSFGQSYYSKARILYTTDESLAEQFEEHKIIGPDDIAQAAMFYACALIFEMDKCRKWLYARKDPLYAQYFLLAAAETLAGFELCLRGQPISRQSIQKAALQNPALLAPFYGDAMARHYTPEEVERALGVLEEYLDVHLDVIKKPIMEFMADGEIKTTTQINRHFREESHFLVNIFDYLVDKGLLDKVTQSIRITPKGRLSVEEIGYLYIPEELERI